MNKKTIGSAFALVVFTVVVTVLATRTGSSPALAQTARDNEEQNRRMSAVEGRLRGEIGEIKMWPGKKAPDGWMICDGHPLSSKQYPDLYAVLENTCGKGEGGDPAGPKTDFNLPDYRGVFLRGVDSGRGKDADAKRDVGSFQDWATARPREAFVTNDAGEHNHGGGRKVICDGNNTPSGLDFTADEINNKVGTTIPESNAGNHHHTITLGGDAETRPANVAVYYIIRVK